MPTNTLTDAQCKRAAAPDGPRKFFDGHGLHLLVTPAGTKTWRMSYRLEKKPQTATFGAYPLVSLADAREKRDEIRRKLKNGESPKKVKKVAGVTFQKAWEAYWEGRQDVSTGYRTNALRALEMHLGPKLGELPVGSITRELLLTELMKMNAAGAFVYVRKVRMWAGQVFDWAVEHGHSSVNPAAAIRPEKAFGREEVESHAALELNQVPELITRLSLERELISVLACKFLALTWVRTKEMRFAKWDQFDGDLWRVPSGTMKKRRDHLVPLSTQALEVLAKMRARQNGDYVFPADHRNDRPLSENSVLYLLHRMGYEGKMTGHGWRTVGSTWANEQGFNGDAIERQLAHAPDDEVRAVYNRAIYLPERRKMLQDWADWLLPGSAPPSEA
ncbi:MULTISPECIES: integrase arm-type DNA-binding domain-containing protein [unclassified Variovorax]|uniref:tyrosine-type recombinase/integrase n=1 Tax=unclassified Variovorax TaxID=663243 RepID=UPI002577E8D0|nr:MULTISPECIES: integrase arm-type DNA-binding domain-containing protein [unclassified Variovorax]MDM0086783.1 integrase arm-type DNA-binding domain-containing protein [Variovorax sp. J22G40]MDM0144961.1 integrase arm-type DNA-binding domain-containing protein [Variovorax sp. J2P1-31]